MAETESAFAFETREALAVVGIDRKAWDSIMQRQLYDGAPTVKAGHPRFFSRDDMVCLYVFRHYLDEKHSAQMAGRIATAVRKELKKGGESLESLWVVLTNGRIPRYVVHKQPPADVFSHVIDIKKTRAIIEGFAASRLGWEKPS